MTVGTEFRGAASVAEQARLLDRCLGLLAPSGVLVYVACSLLRAEGPEQVRRVLSREGAEPRLELSQELRLWPHRHGTDGFYAARLSAS